MADPIRFYFDFSSAYSYRARNRIGRLATDWGREVEWACVPLGRSLEHHGIAPPGDEPARFSHTAADLARLCEMHGLPLAFPPRHDARKATLHRLVFWRLARKDPDLARRFALAVAHRFFGLGGEIRTARQLATACHAAEIGRAHV